MSARELAPRSPDWGRSTVRALTWVAIACGVIFLTGLISGSTRPRTWSGFLMGFHLLVGLAVAGPVGLAFFHLSGARWSRRLESVPRAMTAALPAAAAMGLVLLVGVTSLYHWSHADAVAQDAVLQQKALYLNWPFFAARLVAFFAIWWWAARRLVRVSRDVRGDDPASRRRRLRTAAVFLLLFAPTWSLASVDWMMSLEPHWFSAVYALMTLAGLGLSGLAAGTVLIAALDRGDDVGEARYGDLGALLLSLALFWAYIWYSQYMLIWYTNLPEETGWYAARLGGAWGLLTKVSCVLFGALPFALLLFRRVRRSRRALVRIAVVVLFGRVLELLVLIGPPLMGESPLLGVWELAPVIGQLALFFLLAIRALQREAGAAQPVAALSSSVPVAPAA